MQVVAPEFVNLDAAALAALAKSGIHRNYRHNEFIYLQDDDADYLYFIISGHIRLSYLMEDGSVVLHGILPPGDVFGELGIFDGAVQADMATAVGDTIVSGVPAALFHKLGKQFAGLETAVARLVARRYRSYIVHTRNLTLKTLPARTAQALLRLADMLGSKMKFKGREVSYVGGMVSQSDLGLMARGARGNVNKALRSWERSGWIANEGRCVLILNRAKLEALAIEEEL